MNTLISFVPGEYKKLYPDLLQLSDNKLSTHYYNFGIKEKRIYKEYKNKIPNIAIIYCYLINSDSRINLESSKIKLIGRDNLNLLGDDDTIIYINNNYDFDLTQEKLMNLVELYLTSSCDFLSPLIVSNDNKLVYFGSFIKDSYLIYINENYISNSVVKRNIIKNTFLFFADLFVCRKKNLDRFLKNQYDEFADESLVFKITTFNEFRINNDNEYTKKFKINNSIYNKYELKENIEFIKQFLSIKYSSTIKMQKYKFLDSNSYPYICLITNRIITPDQDFESNNISNMIDLLIQLKFNLHYYVINGKKNNDYSTFLLKKGILIIYLSEEDIENTFENHLNLYKFIIYGQYEINNELLLKIKNLNPISKHILIAINDNISGQTIKNYDKTLIFNKLKYDYFDSTKDYKDNIYYYSKFICDDNINRKPIEKTNDMYFIGSLKDDNEIPLIYFLDHIFARMLSFQCIKFYIIGKICIKLYKYKPIFRNNLILVEYLSDSDLKKFLTGIRVNFVPNIIGKGLRGKMIQSIKYGIPTIITNSDNEIDISGFKLLKCEFNKNNKYTFIANFFNYYNNLKLLKNTSDSLLYEYHQKAAKESSTNHFIKIFNFNTNNHPNSNIVTNNYISIIIVIFQIYSSTILDLENYCIYFNNFKSYYFKIIFVNNNISKKYDDFFKSVDLNKKLYNNLDIQIIEGDNSYYDFSAYQKGLDYVRQNNYEFNAILIINETINERTPIYLHQIKSKIFNIASTQKVVIGHIDKNANPVILQNQKINFWVRSNFILINIKVIESVNYNILYLKNYNDISLDSETNTIINTRLNLPYYQKYTGEMHTLKKLLILNEFFFSFKLSLHSELLDFTQI